MGSSSMIEQLAKRLESAIEPKLGHFEQELQQLRRDIKAVAEELAATVVSHTGSRSGANLGSLKNAVLEIQRQSSQPDALKLLADQAAQFAPRVLLMVVKGTNALGWIGHGFSSAINSNLRNLSVPLNTNCIIREVVRMQEPVLSTPAEYPESSLLLDKLGAAMPKTIAAVPLLVRGKVAGAIYADSGDGGQIQIDALEMLSAACGVTLEIILLGGRKDSPSTNGAKPPQSASGPMRPEPSFGNGRARSASSIFAQTNSGPFEPPVTNDSGEIKTTEVEEAARIARLLVQEIVLYNQAALDEGRRSRDIYNRLRDDIDRSRAAYDRRVSPKVGEDFFYHEMVTVLGEGDPSRLGSNCPGPRAIM